MKLLSTCNTSATPPDGIEEVVLLRRRVSEWVVGTFTLTLESKLDAAGLAFTVAET